MNFSEYIPDLIAIGPEMILCATVLVVLLVDLWRQGRESLGVWLLAPVVTLLAVLALFAGANAYIENPPPGLEPKEGTNPLWPEFFALVAAYATVTIGDIWFKDRDHWVPGVVVLIGTALAAFRLYDQTGMLTNPNPAALGGELYWGGANDATSLVTVDAFSVMFRAMLLLSLAISVWFTVYYRPMTRGSGSRGVGEFLACLIGAHIGGMFLVGTTHLLFVFLSLEMLSLCSYMQAGMLKGDRHSAEASLKYIVYGSVASGLMLFGLSLLYAFSGEMTIPRIAGAISDMSKDGPGGLLLALAIMTTLGGFAYKLSLVPFHFWTPDVYQGSPTPTTAFLSVGSKAASFAILLRFLSAMTDAHTWNQGIVSLLAFAAALTMTYGNLAALRQSNLKRLIAYSSIAHAGYMLMGVVALYQPIFGADNVVTATSFSAKGYEAVIFYLAAYLFMNFGAFGVVIFLANRTGSEELDDMRGLGWKAPWVCGALVVFLLSLTGIPPTAGFIAKYMLFVASIDAGFVWLAVVAALNTVVSLFYYFKIAKTLFLKSEEDAIFEAPRSAWLGIAVIACACFTLWYGVDPQDLVTWAENATNSLR